MMHVKAPHPVNLLSESPGAAELPPLLQVYFEFNQLKRLYRQGWIQRGVPPHQTESVADHVFNLAILGMLVCQAHYPELDAGKVTRMILVHEVGEIYAGDITPAHQIPEAEKHARELASAHEVLDKLPNGAEWLALWLEFEAAVTPEARLVRQLDRLEMGLQAALYVRQGYANLDGLLRSAANALHDPALVALLEAARPAATDSEPTGG